MGETREDIKNIIKEYSLQYAEETIMSRGIQGIDGLKSVQRRILYVMHDKGYNSKHPAVKCAKIVGNTMADFHPHGDAAIYGALVRIVTENGTLNVPYVDGKGNFGKCGTHDEEAAMRYTEARLAKVTDKFFEGLDENAVDMYDTFDATGKEPGVLPVHFPTILVNNNDGLAVAVSSSIPTYKLRNVCLATIGMIKGKYDDVDGDILLKEDIGCLEMPTGGYIRATEADMLGLIKTGEAKIYMDGRVETYPSQYRIDVTEVPYGTKIEDILGEIKAEKDGIFNDVREIRDLSDKNGIKLTIVFKRGTDLEIALRKMYRCTSLRRSKKFKTELIIGNELKSISVRQLINEWILFRIDVKSRIYKFRVDKTEAELHKAKAWEIVAKHKEGPKGFVRIVSENAKAKGVEIVKSTFGLDEIQAQYLMGFSVSAFTVDEVKKHVEKSKEIERVLNGYVEKVNSREKILEEICAELEEVAKSDHEDARTQSLEGIVKKADGVEQVVEEVKISDAEVRIVIYNNGTFKRCLTEKDYERNTSLEDIEVSQVISMKNNQDLLLFGDDGVIYKILANDIDSSRSVPKAKIKEVADIKSSVNIWHIDSSHDFLKMMLVLNEDGSIESYPYALAYGKRRKYKAYNPIDLKKTMYKLKPGSFIIVTQKGKISVRDYTDALEDIKEEEVKDQRKYKWQCTRINSQSGKISRLIYTRNFSGIKDLSRYTCEYPVYTIEGDKWKMDKKEE
jgi:DNA gyrase subunit A